jgi:hypothetical protein
MGLVDSINTICKPLLLFLIFEAAHITYHLYQAEYRSAIINGIFTIMGGALIYLLCSLGFEFAAWLLIIIIPFLFVSLLSFLVFTQIITTDVRYWNGSESVVREVITNKYIRQNFDLPPVDKLNDLETYDYIENPMLDEIVDRYNSGSEQDD